MGCGCRGPVEDPGPGTASPAEAKYDVFLPGAATPELFVDYVTARMRAKANRGVVRRRAA